MSVHPNSAIPKALIPVIFIIILAIIFEFFIEFKSPDINLINTPNKEVNIEKRYKVIDVLDGDTIDVKNLNTEETIRVRLLGINTPEINDEREFMSCLAKKAKNFTKKEILNEVVFLETDSSQDTYDKYGRKLAYVYNLNGEMLNRKLIAQGYANEFTYEKPHKYQKDFKKFENFAKLEKRGLWSDEIICD